MTCGVLKVPPNVCKKQQAISDTPARMIADSNRVVPSSLPEGKRHMLMGFVNSCMCQQGSKASSGNKASELWWRHTIFHRSNQGIRHIGPNTSDLGNKVHKMRLGCAGHDRLPFQLSP
jgi:hypothetical protein